ncbi:MAG: ChbG/HpnK family deacetylase [Bacteroidota bacterium]|nr:ChbG/HpnK family deacetylase [Bacteroidota bacterium]
MQHLIINADDFGKNNEVTYAILSLMDQNLCLDTTLLVNFEDSEHAARLAIKMHKRNNVGIHLNLTEGKPLTEHIKREKRFCNEMGVFHYNKRERIVMLTSSEKRAVYEELSSQIHLCRRFGIPISHADSHNHVHEEPGLFFILMHLLKNEKIPFLRLANNLETTLLKNKFYRNTYNHALSLYKRNGTNYFGSTLDYFNYQKRPRNNSITEIMIHPGKIHNDHVFDTCTHENLNFNLPKIINGNKLISYCQLKYHNAG